MKLKYLLSLLVLIMLNYSCAFSDDYKTYTDEAVGALKKGDYKLAVEKYELAFKKFAPKMNDLYNAACAASLANQQDKAIKFLDMAVGQGWTQLEWIQTDKDLLPLHKHKGWKGIIEKVEKNLKKIEDSFPETHTVLDTIKLPEPRYDSKTSVETAMSERRSVRKYKDEALTLEELSQILWAAYGITEPIEDGPEFLRGGLRTTPSAGALYPLDIYIVVGNVKGLKNGVYLYYSQNHELHLISAEDKKETLSNACYGAYMIQNAPAVLVYSAIFERTTKKYGQRGRERYVCMDLGHSAENVYLQAGALNMGTCAVGAFDDLMVKTTINMTKPEEPLYIMPLGKLKD